MQKDCGAVLNNSNTSRYLNFDERFDFEACGFNFSADISCIIMDESIVVAGPGCSMVDTELYQLEDFEMRGLYVANEDGLCLKLDFHSVPQAIRNEVNRYVTDRIMRFAEGSTDWTEVAE